MPKIPPYSSAFWLEAVRLLRSSGRTISQLARELGCSPRSLRNWSRQIDVDEGKAAGLNDGRAPWRGAGRVGARARRAG